MKKLFFLSILAVLFFTFCSQKQQEKDTKNIEIATNTDTVYIGKYSIQTLEEMGIVAKPATYSLHYVHNVEFNKELIPINVYASVNSLDGYGQFDSLVFFYKGNKHSISLASRELGLFYPISIMREDLIMVDDFNFDGYMDIGIFNTEASGVKNTTYEIYLYYPKEKRYYYARELSGMANLFIDKDRKILSMFWVGGRRSLIFGYSEYKWVKDDSKHLGEKSELVYSVSQESLYPLDLFVRKTNTLINGVWKAQIDTLTEVQAEERWWR